jgi:hypothetical protein
VHVSGKTDSREMCSGIAEKGLFLFVVQAQDRAEDACAAAPVRAKSHVLQDRHLGHHSYMLEAASKTRMGDRT